MNSIMVRDTDVKQISYTYLPKLKNRAITQETAVSFFSRIKSSGKLNDLYHKLIVGSKK